MKRHIVILAILLVAAIIPLRPEGHVFLEFPQGGESLTPGSVVTIRWSVIEHGPAVYSVSFSTDGGVTWTSVADNLVQSTRTFEWTVPAVETTQGKIRVRQYNESGTDYEQASGNFTIESVSTGIDTRQTLDGQPSASTVWPNPVSRSSTVLYTVPRRASVALTIFDALGREVQVLVSDIQPAGTYEITFDATALPSGIYFYRLQAGDYVETKRMVVVR